MSTPTPQRVDDDDDIGAMYRALEKQRQAERAARREDGPARLTKAGIRFESKNLGAHLIVRAMGKTIDFWLGTGLWKVRGFTKKHRGVENLIAICTPAGDAK